MDTVVLLCVLSLAKCAVRVAHAQQLTEPVCSTDVTSALAHHPVPQVGHVGLALLVLLFPEGRDQCPPPGTGAVPTRGPAHCAGLRGIFKL